MGQRWNNENKSTYVVERELESGSRLDDDHDDVRRRRGPDTRHATRRRPGRPAAQEPGRTCKPQTQIAPGVPSSSVPPSENGTFPTGRGRRALCSIRERARPDAPRRASVRARPRACVRARGTCAGHGHRHPGGSGGLAGFGVVVRLLPFDSGTARHQTGIHMMGSMP